MENRIEENAYLELSEIQARELSLVNLMKGEALELLFALKNFERYKMTLGNKQAEIDYEAAFVGRAISFLYSNKEKLSEAIKIEKALKKVLEITSTNHSTPADCNHDVVG